MNRVFEKILDRLEDFKHWEDDSGRPIHTFSEVQRISKCKEIVQEVAKEYRNSQINQLAMMYATSLMLYGVDVTKELETATKQSYDLEQAYIRGRQCERDKFAELRKEYNNGWIPCSERLPEEHKLYDITFRNDVGTHSVSAIYDPNCKLWFWDADETELVDSEVLAWAEKREPYIESRKENES